MSGREKAPVREEFLGRLGFRLDQFQLAAMSSLDRGLSVLVSAPTGSGKTVVADYAIAKTMHARRRAFYTTPLKALSNQKLSELSSAYGAGDVGLLTGDISHLPDAPIVVMTTEVLRNMLFSHPEGLHSLGLVVLDEVHFLQDPYRGSVWEEVLILCPRNVVFVCLSATVSNAEELGAWMTEIRGPTEVVVEDHRPVELVNHIAFSERGRGNVRLAPLLWGRSAHREALALDRGHTSGAGRNAYARRPHRHLSQVRGGRLVAPRRTELLEALGDLQMLPAIVFIFSRAACDDAVAQCIGDGLRLTSREERMEIRRICEEQTEGINDAELRALDYGNWSHALESGVASHHAGMVPAFREAVEKCFAGGLLRVVYATETLALGINMPARTVVIERLTKVREHGRSALTSGEYAQLTGRAGRRGLDETGHAVVVWSPQVRVAELAGLATSAAPELRSSFRPTYNLAVNLVRRFTPERASEVLDKSFAQFQDVRRSDALSSRFDRILALLERRGYVERDNWRLTGSGDLLARIYHESDLLIAEAIRGGSLDGLDPGTLAATVSSFTFESRAGRWHREPRLPGVVVERVSDLGALADALRAEEESLRIARTRAPDGGFAEAALRWARREPLDRVLDRSALSAGDFVRNAKQLIDLLKQIAVVAGETPTSRTANAAAGALLRGVVAAGWMGTLPDSFGSGDDADTAAADADTAAADGSQGGIGGA